MDFIANDCGFYLNINLSILTVILLTNLRFGKKKTYFWDFITKKREIRKKNFIDFRFQES